MILLPVSFQSREKTHDILIVCLYVLVGLLGPFLTTLLFSSITPNNYLFAYLVLNSI